VGETGVVTERPRDKGNESLRDGSGIGEMRGGEMGEESKDKEGTTSEEVGGKGMWEGETEKQGQKKGPLWKQKAV
jgi:hypothetical protein